jgi:succinate-semialdehyde dehydrogenase/glutarate-semialdehyde dehydrogenase
VAASSGRPSIFLTESPVSFSAVDPASGEVLSSHPDTPSAEVHRILDAALAAHLAWRDSSFTHRSERLLVLGGLLRERKDGYARLMTAEMGKPLEQSAAEVEKCAWVADYYAENAEAFLEPVPAQTDATRSYWTYRPLGVVLGIMPWNFPFWQVIRFAAPAVAAGNAALLKHAPSVPGCALALEKLFHDAGFPRDLFRNLFVDTRVAGDLIEDPRVAAVSLTGSVRAGRSVAARAGAAIKKCVLELGGSDPSLVLADADLDAAVSACVFGRLLNTGQSCIAAKRFVVVDEVRAEFEQRLSTQMSAATMGDPMDPGTVIGPMARVDLRDALHDQVQRSVEAGATLVLGGEVPERPGAWYPPTVLTNVGPGMAAYEEELFGPVAVVIPVKDTAEAVTVANDTRFGLGASVYTRDERLGERIASELLEAGNCFVNGIVKSDPRLPFGGIKESGYGRELSPLGIREFTNIKTVWVK